MIDHIQKRISPRHVFNSADVFETEAVWFDGKFKEIYLKIQQFHELRNSHCIMGRQRLEMIRTHLTGDKKTI